MGWAGQALIPWGPREPYPESPLDAHIMACKRDLLPEPLGPHISPAWALRPQNPGLSSPEDDSLSLVTKSPTLRKPLKHSTPVEAALGWSPRPPGDTSYPSGSPVPAHFSQDLASHSSGFSPPATVRKRRLSTIWASKESSMDLSAPGEKPRTSASLAQQQQESLQAKSWSQNPGLPGILDTAGRKRRDPKKRAAAVCIIPVPVPIPVTQEF
ncbi:hypothetical protein P7K49_025008 [Saguinus oedipus]|uniref:Uncharacterized protein n=1 Tax=Saguinus oedipus TaxID=9490 RepID=A0ABQ9UFV7_SAGOE|nr:hypothetical protein P7K49_025008 [Saguinus oedipus]